MADSEASREQGPEAASGFVCVCVQKSVEFDIVDHKLHRANKDRELHEELEKLSSINPSQYAYQLGGGCRIMGTGAPQHPLYVAAWGESVAAFEGTLANLADLAKAFPASHTITTATVSCTPDATSGTSAASPTTITPAPVPAEGSAASGSNPAELLCLMYDVMGQDLLGLLKGKFSFCLYHGKTGRVLAARDGSGTIPLFQGLSPAQSLVISSRKVFTDTCQEVKEFEPGYFKYGWYAEPRKFGPTSASHFNHHGRQNEHSSWHRNSSSARSSIDQPRSGRASMDQLRPSRASMDQSRPGKPGLDKPRTPVLQHGQHANGARSARASMDNATGSGGARRKSHMDGAPAPGGTPGQGKGQGLDGSKSEASEEGWTAVVGHNQRKHYDSGRPAGNAPSNSRHGHRRSMDVKPAQPAGSDKSPKTPPKKVPTATSAENKAALTEVGGTTAAGSSTFKFDINAPVFKPVTC